jgi:hypothetical protein
MIFHEFDLRCPDCNQPHPQCRCRLVVLAIFAIGIVALLANLLEFCR